MKIHTGDKVKVLSGKDKGKISKVLKAMPEKNMVVVEGVNVVKRHVKPGVINKEGGIISIEKAFPASRVMVIDEKTGKPTRIGFKIIDGKKYRVSKKSGEVITK